MIFNISCGLLFVFIISRVFSKDVVHFFYIVKTNFCKLVPQIEHQKQEKDDIIVSENASDNTSTYTKYEDKYLQLLKIQKAKNLVQLPPNKKNKIMEHTPLGNVVMWYEPEKESFHFHSDSTIPYRFLEVIARKYVIAFHCLDVYVDMEEQIESAKQKIQQQKEEKERRKRELEEQAKLDQENKTSNSAVIPMKDKSNVFAKFKNYNKMQSKSSASAPNTVAVPSKENEDMILKENANRFTYDGRFSNFQLLIKVDKKVVDKRLNLSFADFKLLNK